MFPWMPIFAQKLIIKFLLKITVGSYTNYGLPDPDHQLFEHHPTINSDLLLYLQLGKVVPHPGE